MRRRAELPVMPADPGALPECLLAGPCIEVWAPHVRRGEFPAPEHVASGGYTHACNLWRQRHGIGPWQHDRVPPQLRGATPWSYVFLSQAPGRLAQQLRSRGLPPDWQPTPAPTEWRRRLQPQPTFADEKARGRVAR